MEVGFADLPFNISLGDRLPSFKNFFGKQLTDSVNAVNAQVSANLSPNAANGTPQNLAAIRDLNTYLIKAKSTLAQAQLSGDQTAVQKAQETVAYAEAQIKANSGGLNDIERLKAEKAQIAQQFSQLFAQNTMMVLPGMEESWNESALQFYSLTNAALFDSMNGLTRETQIKDQGAKDFYSYVRLSDGTAIPIQEAQLRALKTKLFQIQQTAKVYDFLGKSYWTTLGGQSNQIFGSCAKIFGAGSSGGSGRGYYMA